MKSSLLFAVMDTAAVLGFGLGATNLLLAVWYSKLDAVAASEVI